MVAIGAAPRVVVAGIHHAAAVVEPARRLALESGVRINLSATGARHGRPGGRADQRMTDTEHNGSRQRLLGRKLGDERVRVERPHAEYFRYTGERTLVAKPAASVPRTTLRTRAGPGSVGSFGRPLSNEEELSQRMGVGTGLPVLASDNISSSAYATEEIMRVLVLAGAGALVLTVPITLAVVVVLAIVVISYRQTIAAYPSGGGSYIVASENLGRLPGLTAAGALLTDYILTVAVSIAAGVAALTSIVPELFDYRVAISVALVAVLTIVNLRGVRESGLIFSLPTYVYLDRDLRPDRARAGALRDRHDARVYGPARVVGADRRDRSAGC